MEVNRERDIAELVIKTLYRKIKSLLHLWDLLGNLPFWEVPVWI